jgi:hypothetical protein
MPSLVQMCVSVLELEVNIHAIIPTISVGFHVDEDSVDIKWRLKSVSCERVHLNQWSATYHFLRRGFEADTQKTQQRGQIGVGVSCECTHLTQWSSSWCRHRIVHV